MTLRKDLLAHLGIQPGQRVDVEVLPGGRLELHAEQATGSIHGFIGLLAGRSARRASLEEMNEAAASGWSGLLGSPPTPMCWCGPWCRTILSRPRQQWICWSGRS